MYDDIATTNSNPHYITRPQAFYYGEEMKDWSNTPMAYALDIAIENKFSELLKFPLDRIIYASNDYCFRERTRKNKGELNLPFFNYYRIDYAECSRPWFNDYSNRFGVIDRENNFTSKMGGKMKVYPTDVVYEGSIFFAQQKDCEYAYNKLKFESSNETIITPKLETNKGDILPNAGILNMELEFNPNYKENDWLELNRIWSIGIEFSVSTFMIGVFDKNPEGLHVAKESILQFFSAKKLDYDDWENSTQIEMLLSEYFENKN
jgi:hypothetical protein